MEMEEIPNSVSQIPIDEKTPKELEEAILILGGPRHSKMSSWRGEKWYCKGVWYHYVAIRIASMVNEVQINSLLKLYIPVAVQIDDLEETYSP